MNNSPQVALVYNKQSSLHDTGYFTIRDSLMYHHLGAELYLDEVYKPLEINYPYPFPNTFAHPENQSRIEAVIKAFENWGLLERFRSIEPMPASEAELLAVHSAIYLEWLQKICETKPGSFADEATPISSQSFEAAKISAGAALTAGKLVLSGEVQRSFALTRPPGHHAGVQNAGGFCLFNNAAILAQYALTQPQVERVLLIDWDVHHGNGTQEIFWQDSRVLFNSFHQFGPGIYPGGGDVADVGGGEGRGYTVNVPLPTACPDELYLSLFERVTTTLAAQFRPDLIIVSAGQDGHFNDLRHLYLWEENSGFDLTAQLYYALTRHIIKLADTYCQGRCVFIQEGGYNSTNLANSLLNIGAALLDLPLLVQEQPSHLAKPAFPALETQTETTLASLQANLKEFWDFNLD